LLGKPIPPVPASHRTTTSSPGEPHKIGLSSYYAKRANSAEKDTNGSDVVNLRDRAVAHKRKAQECSKMPAEKKHLEALHYISSIVLFVEDWLRLPIDASAQTNSMQSLKEYLGWVCKRMQELGQDGLTSLCLKLDAIMLLRTIPTRTKVLLRDLDRGQADAKSYATETLVDFRTADARWKESIRFCNDLSREFPDSVARHMDHLHSLADVREFATFVKDCIKEWSKLKDTPFEF